jgi:hypothetical protein
VARREMVQDGLGLLDDIDAIERRCEFDGSSAPVSESLIVGGLGVAVQKV